MEETKEISALFKLIDDPDRRSIWRSVDKLLILEESLFQTWNTCGKHTP